MNGYLALGFAVKKFLLACLGLSLAWRHCNFVSLNTSDKSYFCPTSAVLISYILDQHFMYCGHVGNSWIISIYESTLHSLNKF